MKKLLLGLGTLSLAILPVAAMVSCSATTPTLETEATKFTTEVVTKDTTAVTSAVVKEITDGADAAARLVSVEKYATLPTIAEGFTFEVKTAAVKVVAELQNVEVIITVTETANTDTATNSKDATLTITGLAVDSTIEVPTLETEAAKFVEVAAIDGKIKVADAATAINDAADAAAKQIALEVYTILPTLAEGFSLEVKSAAADTTVKTTLNVTITITDATSTTKDVTLVITGFTEK